MSLVHFNKLFQYEAKELHDSIKKDIQAILPDDFKTFNLGFKFHDAWIEGVDEFCLLEVSIGFACSASKLINGQFYEPVFVTKLIGSIAEAFESKSRYGPVEDLFVDYVFKAIDHIVQKSENELILTYRFEVSFENLYEDDLERYSQHIAPQWAYILYGFSDKDLEEFGGYDTWLAAHGFKGC